jgi:hypothetical protein
MLVDPAALGGLAGLIAVASWAIGRGQGPFARPVPQDPATVPAPEPVMDAMPEAGSQPPSPSPVEPSPCQQRALEERRAALARPFVLAELRAEVSAIRRDERIFADPPELQSLVALPRVEAAESCRFIGLSGQPTCPDATGAACPDAARCRAAASMIAPRAIPGPL